MEKQGYKVSKLFVPQESDRFTMLKFIEFQSIHNNDESIDDAEMDDISVPTGIIDAWKVNHKYKELLSELGISRFDNQHAILVINEQINKHSSQKEIDDKLGEGLFDENEIKEQNDFVKTQSKINAIILWRTTRLSISSIAFKSWI